MCVICTECGMVLEVLGVSNFNLTEGHVSTYYHVPNLNEHMQLHEEA
jgi:hypothetical protein